MEGVESVTQPGGWFFKGLAMNDIKSYILTRRQVDGVIPLLAFFQREEHRAHRAVRFVMASNVCPSQLLAEIRAVVWANEPDWLSNLVCETVIMLGKPYCISRVYDAIDCEQSYTTATEQQVSTPTEVQVQASGEGT